MAYCPQCGREQKCGCEECHICGVGLVEKGPPPAAKVTAVPKAAEVVFPQESRRDHVGVERREETVARRAFIAGRSVLSAVLLILALGVFLVTLIEMIRAASGFVGQGGAPSVLAMFRRIGYQMGNLLYTNAVRILLGFALFTLGLMIESPRPFTRESSWSVAVRADGLAMIALSVAFLLSFIFLLIPRSVSLITRNLLPSLAAAIPIFLILGISLLACGYILMRSSSGPGRLTRQRRGKRSAEGPGAPGD